MRRILHKDLDVWIKRVPDDFAEGFKLTFREIVTREVPLSLTRRTRVVMGSSSGLILVINSSAPLLGPAERVCWNEQYREQASCPRSK